MKPISIIFFGTPDFAVPSLRALIENRSFMVRAVVTQPDRPAGRGQKLRYSPVKELAIEHKLPVLQPKSLRKELEAFLRDAGAHGPFDVGIVAAFGQILPPDVLTLPRAGCVNVHGSLLPRWRGAAPIQRAIMAGDAHTGVCLMQMDEGLDTGTIYAVERIPITPEDTAGSLHDRLAAVGAKLIEQQLPQIVSGRVKAVPQEEAGVTYAAKIGSEEQRIAWGEDARLVARRIMGLSPFPGAWTTVNDRRVKILSAVPIPSIGDSEPGTILRSDPSRLEVACRGGVVRIQTLQIEGRRAMTAEEFLRGHPDLQGQRFV